MAHLIYDTLTFELMSWSRFNPPPPYDAATHTAVEIAIGPIPEPREIWRYDGAGNYRQATEAELGMPLAQWLAENGGDPIQTNRRRAKEPCEEFSGRGVEFRSLIELINKRDNRLVTVLNELKDRVQAMISSSGAVQNLRDAGAAVPVSNINTRPRPEAVQDFKQIINNGSADT